MRGWLKSVDDFWFAKGSPTSLGVLRIFIGFFALLDLLMLTVSFSDWFGEKSFVPLAAAKQYIDPMDAHFTLLGLENFLHAQPALPASPPRIDLLGGIESMPVIMAFYSIVVIAAFFTMIGLWSKVSSIVLAVGVVSIHHRNGVILNGADTVLRLSILYLALSPCGLACSVDRLRALWKGKIGPEAPQVSLWTQKLVQYNVALLYFTTFWLKFGQGMTWRNLTATYYSAHINEFHKFWTPEFMNRPPVTYITSLMTLVIELSLATLVFYRPARNWVLLGGLLLHGFIEYSMNIPLFGFLVCSLYICFYSGEEIAAFFLKLGQRYKRFAVQVSLPTGTGFRLGPAHFLSAVDPMALVSYKSDSDRDITARDVKRSWTRSLGAWPIGWIPGAWRRVLLSAVEPGVQITEATPQKSPKKKVRA